MMRDIQFTADHERILREQAFTADQPGSVLDDFGMVLEFLRYHKGVEAAGKHNLLPMKLIGELDHCLSRPLHLEMKRPLLRSHPYLQGLNLLLRASGLTRVEGVGAKARLCVDPSMLAQWEQLNSVEQYFNLLEAWLRFGRTEMVGETRGSGDGLLHHSMMAWRSLPAQGTQFDITRPSEVFVAGIYRHFYQLALMDLFGIVEVERPHHHVAPWCPAGIKRVPFGDALFTLITSRCDYLGIGQLIGEEDEDEDEDGPELPTFGAWQSIFQPYFPEWRENLEFSAVEPREGTFVFRVLLGKVWRLIAIPADASLDHLVHLILRSVNFDSDHLYSVTYRDRMGTQVRINGPDVEDGPSTDGVQIGALPLEPGQTMDLLYDFGDNWEFTIKLDRIEPPGTKIKAPGVIESHGKAPEQYPDWDE
jgi:Plasmid pRiA4b ORF-3-like protein